ncbi:MAG TPA: winged helix DNA-binding domain-containing protein [Gaiellaceae bacterium]|nr:winged helix DNA-binding domain-containing protein [Gaiellaceae bacterium]
MAGEERVLTQRDLNRALLARQLLLERAKAPLPRALERVGGIQAQYAPSMYIGLWSRLEAFEREQLTSALERRSVVQGTLMRTTIHLVSKGDYWLFAVGIRRLQREWWVRTHKDLDEQEVKAAARKLRPHLRKGPLRQAEVNELLAANSATRNGVGIFLNLVRVPPSGTWERRRADIYALAEDWIEPEQVTEQEGIDLLVRRYLSGFGPAPKADIADWAALNIADVTSAVERIELRRCRDEHGKELFDLPRAPLPDPETPAPVRFLPVWDATLLVHARRTGILPEEYRPRVFNVKTPHSVNTFLVDGQVAGTWNYDKGAVKLSPFDRLDRATRRELDDEAERLAELHA